MLRRYEASKLTTLGIVIGLGLSTVISLVTPAEDLHVWLVVGFPFGLVIGIALTAVRSHRNRTGSS